MSTIPDPTLYGPPTIYQWAREMMKEQCDLCAADYQAEMLPLMRQLEWRPADTQVKERLVHLEQAARRHLDAIARPFLDILMCEPMPMMFLVKQDGAGELTFEPLSPLDVSAGPMA